MATRTDYGKENRLRARRLEVNRSKAENNAGSKVGDSTRSQNADSRKNIIDSKPKRNPGASQNETKHKTYNKFGAPPKRVISSDKAFITPLKNENLSKREERPRVPRKPSPSAGRGSVNDKGSANKEDGDQEKNTKPNVSKLKNIFDETIANEAMKAQQNFRKSRPISEALERLKGDDTTSTSQLISGRWSLPSYYKKTLPTSPNDASYKPHVSQGIAARRALFESGGSSEDVRPREKRSPSLLDLVPDLKDLDLSTLGNTSSISSLGTSESSPSPRSRTRSDPGTNRPMYFIHSRKRHTSETNVVNGEYRETRDDSVLRNPPLTTDKRLFKSNSVDQILLQSLGPVESKTNKEDETIRKGQEPSLSEKEEKAISSQAESKARTKEKHGISDTTSQNGLVFRRKEVAKDDFLDETPGRLREATWKDEEIPPEELAELDFTSSSVKHDFATVRDSVALNEIKTGHELPGKGTGDAGKTESEQSDSSGEDSTGSVVEHSDVEDDSVPVQQVSPVALLFSGKPMSSSLSKGANKERSRKRSVSFADGPKIFPTYSREDYDRGIEDVDPVAAKAAWELEKRVEKMDIFSVDLSKGMNT